jgi:arsenate reductase
MAEDDGKPRVLLVCSTSSGRSHMAKAFLRAFTRGHVIVASAVLDPSVPLDPNVVAAMAETDIELAGCEPALLTAHIAANADFVVAVNCAIDGLTHVDSDWRIGDPAGKSLGAVRAIRDEIRVAAAALAERFLEAATPAR